jgi:polysaccharide pyruvyl transferase WcaK-like protein
VNILVLGWYFKQNLGDNLFIEAFQHLFPQHQFTFTDKITLSQLNDIQAVFIGGGSFINQPCQVAPEAWSKLTSLPICYVGIGAETNIHDTHRQLMSIAKLIAIRSDSHLDIVNTLNSNTLVIPDLVYSLPVTIKNITKPKSILYIPNVSVVPKWDSPHWKHAAWEYFKSEMAQSLDLLSKEFEIKFFPFCHNNKLSDVYTSGEIINRMCHTKDDMILSSVPGSLQEAIDMISPYTMTITQRFHGTVLSEMAQVPCLTIHHHDKLKNSLGSKIPYYGCHKQLILDEIKNVLSTKNTPILPIDRNIFESLRERVEDALCRS